MLPIRLLEQASSAPALHFIHIPKTGGTAIEQFGEANGFRWGRVRSDLPDLSGPASSCSNWHIPRGLFIAAGVADPYADLPTFCVTRHPYSRAISEFIYESMLSRGCGYIQDEKSACDVGDSCSAAVLNQWVVDKLGGDHTNPFLAASPSELSADSVTDDCHLVPQIVYVGMHKEHCARQLEYDHLDEEFDQLMKEHNVPVNGSLSDRSFVSNAASCSLPVGALDERARALIETVYARDFAMFGYDTALAEERHSASSEAREFANANFLSASSPTIPGAPHGAPVRPNIQLSRSYNVTVSMRELIGGRSSEEALRARSQRRAAMAARATAAAAAASTSAK